MINVGDRVKCVNTKGFDSNIYFLINKTGEVVHIKIYGDVKFYFVKFDVDFTKEFLKIDKIGYNSKLKKICRDIGNCWLFVSERLEKIEDDDDSQFEDDFDEVNENFKDSYCYEYNNTIWCEGEKVKYNGINCTILLLPGNYEYNRRGYSSAEKGCVVVPGFTLRGGWGNGLWVFLNGLTKIIEDDDDSQFEEGFDEINESSNLTYDIYGDLRYGGQENNPFKKGDIVKCIAIFSKYEEQYLELNRLYLVYDTDDHHISLKDIDTDDHILYRPKVNKGFGFWHEGFELVKDDDDSQFEEGFELEERYNFLNEEYEYTKQKLNNIFLNAVKSGNIESAKWALDNGAKVSFRKNAAIYNAVYHSRLPMIKMLVEAGANPQISKEKENVHHLFSLACYKGNLNVVKYLFELGADIRENNGMPLNNSIISGNIDIIKYLFSKGLSMDDIDEFSLGLAIRNRRYDIIKLLLEKDYNFSNLILDEIYTYMHYDKVIHFFDSLLKKDPLYIQKIGNYVMNIPELKKKYDYLLKADRDFEVFN